MRVQDLIGEPFAITNKGWYVLYNFLRLTGARNVDMLPQREPYVPQRTIVQWGQIIANAGAGDWYLVGRYNGIAVVPNGVVHASRVGEVEDQLELTPLVGTLTYAWLLSVGQDLAAASSGYLISGKPRKGPNHMSESIQLTKGAKVDVAKAAADAGNTTGLSKVSFRCGWDVRQGTGAAYDLDAGVVACDDAGNAVSREGFVYFNNLQAFSGAIKHHGDELTGAAQGDDEIIDVDLSALPENVVDLRLYVAIFEAKLRGNQTFSVVQNAFVRLVDEATGAELVRFDLSEDTAPSTNTIEFAKLYKHNGAWQFKALATEFDTEVQGIIDTHKVP